MIRNHLGAGGRSIYELSTVRGRIIYSMNYEMLLRAFSDLILSVLLVIVVFISLPFGNKEVLVIVRYASHTRPGIPQ